MNGRVLLLCAGNNEHWKSPAPKQLIRVADNEVLIARTIRQCKTRFSGEDPLLISHLPSLRSYSHNAIFPRKRRYAIETLFSSRPLWGEAWTIVLLGDVFYTDALINLVIDEREKHKYKFYGTSTEIYACTFTDNSLIASISEIIVCYAENGRCRGKLWDLYYALSGVRVEQSNEGRILLNEESDAEHYYTVHDGSSDFDTLEQYSQWLKKYEHKEIKL